MHMCWRLRLRILYHQNMFANNYMFLIHNNIHFIKMKTQIHLHSVSKRNGSDVTPIDTFGGPG